MVFGGEKNKNVDVGQLNGVFNIRVDVVIVKCVLNNVQQFLVGAQ